MEQRYPPKEAIAFSALKEQYAIAPSTFARWLRRKEITPYRWLRKKYVLPQWVETYQQEKGQKRVRSIGDKIRLTDAARALSLSPQALHDHRRRGNISAYRIGKGWYVDFQQLSEELTLHRKRGRKRQYNYLVEVGEKRYAVRASSPLEAARKYSDGPATVFLFIPGLLTNGQHFAKDF